MLYQKFFVGLFRRSTNSIVDKDALSHHLCPRDIVLRYSESALPSALSDMCIASGPRSGLEQVDHQFALSGWLSGRLLEGLGHFQICLGGFVTVLEERYCEDEARCLVGMEWRNM
jgi:hypothetical protein